MKRGEERNNTYDDDQGRMILLLILYGILLLIVGGLNVLIFLLRPGNELGTILGFFQIFLGLGSLILLYKIISLSLTHLFKGSGKRVRGR